MSVSRQQRRPSVPIYFHSGCNFWSAAVFTIGLCLHQHFKLMIVHNLPRCFSAAQKSPPRSPVPLHQLSSDILLLILASVLHLAASCRLIHIQNIQPRLKGNAGWAGRHNWKQRETVSDITAGSVQQVCGRFEYSANTADKQKRQTLQSGQSKIRRI